MPVMSNVASIQSLTNQQILPTISNNTAHEHKSN
jgi:hypothetical protein